MKWYYHIAINEFNMSYIPNIKIGESREKKRKEKKKMTITNEQKRKRENLNQLIVKHKVGHYGIKERR